MLRKLIILLYFFTAYTYAGFSIDLTDPRHLKLADLYPSYEMMTSMDFNETNGDFSLVAFKTFKDNESWDTLFVAKIASSIDGTAKIYITLASKCSDPKSTLSDITIKTNDQNVRYHRYCDGMYIYITPVSKAGDNFLVNEFKTNPSVMFGFKDVPIIINAVGFTNKWNSFGGDAL